MVKLVGQARLGKTLVTWASYFRRPKARLCSSPTSTKRSQLTCAQRRTVKKSSGALSKPALRRECNRIWAAVTRVDRNRRYKGEVKRRLQSNRQKEASLRRRRPRSIVGTINLAVTISGATSQKESSTMLDRLNGRLASLATTPSTASLRSSAGRTTITTRSTTTRSMDCRKPRTSTISLAQKYARKSPRCPPVCKSCRRVPTRTESMRRS